MQRIIQHQIAKQRASGNYTEFFKIMSQISECSQSIDFDWAIDRLNAITYRIEALPEKQRRIAEQIRQDAKLRQAFRQQLTSGGYVKFIREYAR